MMAWDSRRQQMMKYQSRYQQCGLDLLYIYLHAVRKSSQLSQMSQNTIEDPRITYGSHSCKERRYSCLVSRIPDDIIYGED